MMTNPLLASMLYRDFFLSRAGGDRAFAIWIGKLIAVQGKSYILQDEHFQHENFIGAMDAALKSGARVVALLSQAYLDSDYCMLEATTPLNGDAFNREKRLILLRVEPCVPGGVLTSIARTDLLAERRQADATALALKILRALGFDNPRLDGIPPPPVGVLTPADQIIHPEIRITRSDLAPREDLMARLASAMRGNTGRMAALTNSQYLVGAVAGMGGVGKTVLAREFARQHAARYQGVWWIDAEQRGTMLSGLAGLGAELSATIKAETNVEHAARATLRLIEDAGYAKPFLLVYDNVEKPGDVELWTPRAGAHVLITTRFTGWDPMVGTVDVGVLDREAAIDFLCQRTGRPDDREEAGLLADELGCLPLALDHAASYCRAPPRPRFKAYRERLLANRLQHKPTGGSQAGQYRHSVRETFNIALERVIAGDATAGVKACPEAEIVMGVAALLAPVPIPASLFSGRRFANADVDAAFRALSEVSLIAAGEDSRGETVFTVHRLVQHVMADRLAEAGETADKVALAVDLLNLATPREPGKFESWEVCATLLPHAESALAHAETFNVSSRLTALLAIKAGQYLDGRHDPRAALPLLEKALAMYEAIDGPEADATGTAITSLASAYQGLARFAEAEAMFRRDLAITTKHSGPNASTTATVLGHLASSIQAQGRYAEAEPHLRQSLTIREEVLGPEHPDTAVTLGNLASLYEAQGRYTEAEPLFRRSLANHEAVFGAEHPQTSGALQGLAGHYKAQGRYAEAEPLYQRALTINEKTVGPEHPYTSMALQGLAGLYKTQGRYTEAKRLLDRSLAIDEKTLGAEHPDTAETLNVLADLYQEQGRYAQAEPLFQRALTINEKTVGPEHPSTSRTLHELGCLCRTLGLYAEAEVMLKRSFAINESVFGPEHPSTSVSQHELAYLYQAQGRYAECELLLKRSLAIQEQAVGPEHPNMWAMLHEFARLRQAQGRYMEAETLLKRSLAINEKTFGPEHPSRAISLRQWAIQTLETGRVDEAEASIGRALSIQQRAWGPDHPRLGQTYDPLALIALAKGDLPQAERVARDALALRLAKLPEGHPDIAQSRWTLARVLIAKGRATEAEPLLKEAIAALEGKVTGEHVWLKGARQTLAALHGTPGLSQPAQSPAATKNGRWLRWFRPART